MSCDSLSVLKYYLIIKTSMYSNKKLMFGGTDISNFPKYFLAIFISSFIEIRISEEIWKWLLLYLMVEIK